MRCKVEPLLHQGAGFGIFVDEDVMAGVGSERLPLIMRTLSV
jgi:hypothetical protein